MQQAADEETMAATDLAEHLVRGGMPFREAHAVVGDLVQRSLAGGGTLVDLVAADERLGSEAADLVGPGVGVRMRRSPGAAGPDALPAQLEAFRSLLADERAALGR
jgi:argininosuccinate lyase